MDNPYIAPHASFETHHDADAPALWNPTVAAGLSFFLTPVFGSILHMKNWTVLGQPEKAKQARSWAIMMGIALMAVLVLCISSGEGSTGKRLGDLFGVAMLLAWYMFSGREQVRFVERFNNYPKRGWGQPVMAAIAAVFLTAVLLGIVMAIVK